MNYCKKKIGLLILICSWHSMSLIGQIIGVNYQAIISAPPDANSIPFPGEDIRINYFASSDLALRFSIFNQEDLEYIEVHKTQTNKHGEVNLIIGAGQSDLGNFSDIIWDGKSKTLSVEIDYLLGAGFQKISEENLYYLPHPLSHQDAEFIAENNRLTESIRKAAGLEMDGSYKVNLEARYLYNALSLSDADKRLANIVQENSNRIFNMKDDQQIDASFEEQLLRISIERGGSRTVDLSPLMDGAGTDDQKASEVRLSKDLLIVDETVNSAEGAIVALKKYMDALSSNSSDDQRLTLDEEKHILALEQGGQVDLSSYVNSDDQTALEVQFEDDLDVNGDGDNEGNVEQALRSLVDLLFGCTRPMACNFDPKVLYDKNELCIYPQPGENCEGISIVPGVFFQGGYVVEYDASRQTGLIIADSDVSWGTRNIFKWGCRGTDVSLTADHSGMGGESTNAILQACVLVPTAASMCHSYVNNGFTDWVLPTAGDLEKIYLSRETFSGLDGFEDLTSDSYWSSSQYSRDEAKGMRWSDGKISSEDKLSEMKLRAVRYVNF